MKFAVLSALSSAFCLLSPLARAQVPGSVDGLNANITGGAGLVLALAVQADGKMIIAGTFTSVLGMARGNVARLNADGTLDTVFDPKTNGQVQCVTVQPDGRILLGGNFTTLQPNGAAVATIRNGIARLNADGSLDTPFDPNTNGIVYCVALQEDGKMLIGGTFTTLKPNGATLAVQRSKIARVHADGTLDSFDPKAGSDVTSVAVQPDGKVLIGGQFSQFQPNGAASPTIRHNIARLEAIGTLDPVFDPNTNGIVDCVALQPDGRVVLGGAFTTLKPNGAASTTARNRIARVNADGTLDSGFDPNASSTVTSVAMQADGKLLVAGNFTSLQPNGAASATARGFVARLNADGTLDAPFYPRANNAVFGVVVQSDGKVLLGGGFTTVQGTGAVGATGRVYFARVTNDPATQTLSAPDSSLVLWQRGGASPELSGVVFEQSLDEGNSWTLLGPGLRMGATANWQLSGPSLPAAANLSVRARGFTNGGMRNGGFGVVESIAPVQGGQSLESWRESHFGPGATNTGSAADAADPDFDGLANLVEYALGGDPLLPSTAPAPEFAAPVFTFTRNVYATDVSLRVESSTTIATGSWTAIATRSADATEWTPTPGVTAMETAAGLVTINDSVASAALPRRFLRLVVTHP